MPSFKILTINILNDLSRWDERKNLLAQNINALQPDLIALQEVKLPLNNAQWLADQVGGYTVYLCPKAGKAKDHEGIAILSRLPVEGVAHVDLQGQGRVAQYLRLKINNQILIFANTHIYWEPGESKERLKQVERLLEWLRLTPADAAMIVCGDFNGEPDQLAIKRMRKNFKSAYAARHGKEPDYTCPTPLKNNHTTTEQLAHAAWGVTWRAKAFWQGKATTPSSNWRGTLDYIFFNDCLKAKACDVVLNKPAAHDAALYPSDHFGLMATLEL